MGRFVDIGPRQSNYALVTRQKITRLPSLAKVVDGVGQFHLVREPFGEVACAGPSGLIPTFGAPA